MMLQRKITFRLYPNATQKNLLEDSLALHCRAYNTLLEEHRRRHESGEPFFSFSAMCREITTWRKLSPALGSLNAQSLQVTARRVDLAFAAFFRRVKAGEEPGYPRFKSLQRFRGWGYKTHGDGWKVIQPRGKHGKIRLSGIGEVPMRGKGRFSGTPKTAEVLRRGGKWYLSVTYNVRREDVSRKKGIETGAFDWGIDTLLTLVTQEGSLETVENPRWLKSKLESLKTLQRAVSREEARAKVLAGLDPGSPLSKGQHFLPTKKLKRLYAQVRNLHGKIARQRHDFYHKLSAELVSRFGFLGTENLEPSKMSRRPKKKESPDNPGVFLPNGAAAKSGLNRGILDGAPAKLLGMLRTKAEEAASEFTLGNTRKMKPSQRCHRCGTIVPKTLRDRVHTCSCGCICGRDENAARTILRWMLEGEFWSGTGQAIPPKGLQETPSISAVAD